jgi:hypothetical protein
MPIDLARLPIEIGFAGYSRAAAALTFTSKGREEPVAGAADPLGLDQRAHHRALLVDPDIGVTVAVPARRPAKAPRPTTSMSCSSKATGSAT